MNFNKLLKKFTQFVESNDGNGLASMFLKDGIYDDYIYGKFKGRVQIASMLGNHFHRDAKNLRWEMHDPVYKDGLGYARYRFSFTTKLEENLSYSQS